MCFALLTCSPPNFSEDPTGDPLIISPYQPELTAGMSFTFVAEGGTPPYTFSRTGNGSINSSTGRYTAAVTPTPPTATVTVTDHENKTASTLVTILPSQLWVVPAEVVDLPANTSITFNGQGGTPPYTYLKTGGVGSIDSSTGVYISAIGGTAQIKVTDTGGQNVTTNVEVNPPEVPLAISPSSAVIETNVDLQFNASGGSGGYSYQVVPGGKGTITGGGLYSSGGSAGTATVRVTDSLSHTADAAVTVNDPPPPLTITPTSATVVPLTTQAFTAAGGTPPYTFSLVGDGSIAPTGNPRTYTAPGTAGSATLTVTDSRARTASAPITVTAVLGITPSSTSIEVLGTVMLVATGGTPPYTSWTAAGGGSVPPSSDGPTVIYTAPSSPVVATVTVWDNAGIHADCIITVTPGQLAISPATITLQVGNTVIFSADGGASYTFEVLSGVGSIATLDSLTAEYSAGSSEGTAIVRVTDNYLRTQDAAVTVNPLPLTLSPSSIAIQAGSSVTFTGEGGTRPYTFTKESGTGSITKTSDTTALYTSSVEGSAVVKVTDSHSRTDTASVTIDPPPAPPLNLGPASVNVEAGDIQTFSASGGAAPYTWDVVQGAPGGTITQSGVYTAPTTSGTYTVRVTDHDATFRTATANVYDPLAISPNPTSVDAGAFVDFSASGGIPPYTFTLPTEFGELTPIDADTVRYTAPGITGSETIRVTDSHKSVDWSFAILDPATWSARQPVDTAAKPGQYASLTLDNAGNPRIAYYESQGKTLKYAKWVGPLASDWVPSTVDTNGDAGQYASLALDNAGNPRIAYYVADNPKKNLRYAAWNGSTWIVTDVDTGGDVGQYASLALDSSDRPRIAYYDATNKNLKYAKWVGPLATDWEFSTVDSGGDVGQYASLALDSSDRPRIAYYDASNKDLEYAKWVGPLATDWEFSTVDSGGDVGQYASLKLTDGELPCIAYYDATGKNLKYVWRDLGDIWQSAGGNSDPASWTIDSTGDVGQYASLALDQHDSHPLIAYYDLTNSSLKYAELNVAIWLTLTVDAPNTVGQYASLAVNAAGLMRIAYYNATSQDLLYISEQ
jgi:plastocyanin